MSLELVIKSCIPALFRRGTVETQAEYIPRTKIDVIVKDDQVEQLVSELTDRLGSELGGKIFVSDISIAVDLRTKKPETVRSKQRAIGADYDVSHT